mmetsp:Transcript_11036/g.17441  ORF Transcript_11036/g.17441 Transcript_11036/m.17441 type:complete len:483 (-) Transcript_11036:659-2107(-)
MMQPASFMNTHAHFARPRRPDFLRTGVATPQSLVQKHGGRARPTNENQTPEIQPTKAKGDGHISPLKISLPAEPSMPNIIENLMPRRMSMGSLLSKSAATTSGKREQNVISSATPGSAKWKQKLAALHIPLFRREESFVGKTEGFMLCEDLFSPTEGTATASSSSVGAIPQPNTTMDIPDSKYHFDFLSPRIDGSGFNSGGPSISQGFPKPTLKKNPFERIDFSRFADTNVQGELVLGALPVKLPTPRRLPRPRAVAVHPKAVHTKVKVKDEAQNIPQNTKYQEWVGEDRHMVKAEPKQETKVEKHVAVKKHRRKTAFGNAAFKKRSQKKKVRYACRQAFARSRPRIGGRFVNKEELAVILADPKLSSQLNEGKSINLKDVKAAAAAQAAARVAASEERKEMQEDEDDMSHIEDEIKDEDENDMELEEDDETLETEPSSSTHSSSASDRHSISGKGIGNPQRHPQVLPPAPTGSSSAAAASA